MTHATYRPRSDWNARPPNGGPGPLTPSRVKGAVIHWPGSGETDSFDNDAEIASALRGWQNFHMDVRGWSDIAYQVAFSQDGDVWNLRGMATQSGANEMPGTERNLCRVPADPGRRRGTVGRDEGVSAERDP